MQVYCETFCMKLTIHSRHHDHLGLRKVHIAREHSHRLHSHKTMNVQRFSQIVPKCCSNYPCFPKNQVRNQGPKSQKVTRARVSQWRLIWRRLYGTVTAARITIESENDLVRYPTQLMSGTRTATWPTSAGRFCRDLVLNCSFGLMKNGPL